MKTSIMITALLASAVGCNCGSESEEDRRERAAAVIAIDGSSTVFPITEAVAEEFHKEHRYRVTIGVSGTGGGFQKLCAGETAMTGASRPIKPTEVARCRASNIEYIELPVAYDGLSVVVHPSADWVDHMTVEELKKLWEPEAQARILRWSQIREGWPDREIHLFGAGIDSGTYDYFTAAVVGTEHSSRGDFTSSEDDNVLVQGVAGDPFALGFFGFAYYAENTSRLKIVPIAVDDAPPVAPSLETVANGSYQPLSRPIFLYVSKAAVERDEVASFVDFYIRHAPALSQEVGYIPLPQRAYQLVAQRFEDRVVGSVFEGGSEIGVTVEQLLVRQR